MKVAFDVGVPLDGPTGVSRYQRRLGEALTLAGVELEKYQISLRGRDVDSVARWRRPARIMDVSWRLFNRPAITNLVGRVDLVHGTNFILPPLGGALGALTIHDLSFRPDYGFVMERRLTEMVPWSLKHATIALVPSEAVAFEVASRYDFPEHRIHVTPEGVERSFFDAVPLDDGALETLGVTKPFAVAVGAQQPRKNLFRLVEAWRRVAPRLSDWKLVLVGPKGWGPRLPAVHGVILTGWVGEDSLRGLLAAAEFSCYLSLYEGFGLPPLESMAAGTPCLVAEYSAAPEVVGECALMVSPFDEDAIAEAIVTLSTDDELARRLAQNGKERARKFTWERTAALTLQAYKDALSAHS
ncbi:MAG: glycosyltransferase family 4 protein [Actinomycetota bacterium]